MDQQKDKAYQLRLPTPLWDELSQAATAQGLSVNTLINLVLAGSLEHTYEVSVRRVAQPA
jgi:predicted HicB family RNase H-like nuclease